MLKVKESTAKMYLNNPEYENFEQLGENVKEKYVSRRPTPEKDQESQQLS